MQTDLVATAATSGTVEWLPNEDEKAFLRHFESQLRQAGEQRRSMSLATQRALISVVDLVRTHTLLRVVQALHLQGRAAREFTLDVLLQHISADEAEAILTRTFSD